MNTSPAPTSLVRLRVHSFGRAISRDDAQPLRAAVIDALDRGARVELDFEDKRIASSSFLDEVVTSLVIERGLASIDSSFDLVRIDRNDRKQLDKILAMRRRTAERASLTPSEPTPR